MFGRSESRLQDGFCKLKINLPANTARDNSPTSFPPVIISRKFGEIWIDEKKNSYDSCSRKKFLRET